MGYLVSPWVTAEHPTINQIRGLQLNGGSHMTFTMCRMTVQSGLVIGECVDFIYRFEVG